MLTTRLESLDVLDILDLPNRGAAATPGTVRATLSYSAAQFQAGAWD